MPRLRKTVVIVTLLLLGLFLGVLVGGCATSRQMDELKAQVRNVEAQNRQTQKMVARIDSTIAEDTEANKRLRNDMSMAIDDLQRQIAQLLENYNDLMQRIEKLAQRPTISSLQSSPGAVTPPPALPGSTPSTEAAPIDCSTTYDESFILVRRGEYEKAIEGFRTFLQYCPKHELAENAYYWIGECYYSLEKYEQAIAEFEYLLNNYRSSVNASRALYKLGRSQQELGKKKEAKKTFRKLIDEFPGTLEAEQAKERLKDLQ
jgi:tol-pal system protein YbgF